MTVDDDDPIGLGVAGDHHSEGLHHVDNDDAEHSEVLEEDSNQVGVCLHHVDKG